jgi:hypothetical protein
MTVPLGERSKFGMYARAVSFGEDRSRRVESTLVDTASDVD